MEPSFQALLKRLDHLSNEVGELREGVQKAVLVADVDPEMALARARKVLEHVIRDVYERRVKEPPGTRPLENLIQRLVKDGHFPDRLDAYATAVRKLGNVGTHTFGDTVTAVDVYQSLTQLMPILEWYFEVERPDAPARQPPQERGRIKSLEAPPAGRSESKIAVVPKGLRSFDANDAKFFLDLLPGPRDENGLPQSIRFWKHRVEASDELGFTVGVIYGPSGCGKSSLVKAGLLPRLADRVLSVYVEATAGDTEARLLGGLRKRCPGLPGEQDLLGAVTALRQGHGLTRGQKVLVVVDQFEQWLHARGREENTELAQALRQCDGEHVQCIVMVRDDFWVALSRFMSDLHIELVEGQNIALVDLFDLRHAQKVLSAFGRAFGALSETLSKQQELFLDQAVRGLAQDGRVICVRLSLFAEMVKSKPWTPSTLKEIGGIEGVGVVFLEETFSNAKCRLHQNAARRVLKALLPEQGTDIKGNMRSQGELLEGSGYAGRPREFEELLRVLDGELRLITPTDLEGKAEGGRMQDEPTNSSFILPPSAFRYYQLTHDYLVPSLRDWLTRKQKETRRGRAALRLAERAALWSSKPENRHLPAWWEFLNIRCLTQKKNWTTPQQKMMRKAARYHAVRGTALAVLLAVLTLTGLAVSSRVIAENKATHAAGLVQRLLDAQTVQVPGIVAEIANYRRWADELLRREYDQAPEGSRRKLHASMALLPVDAAQVDYLYQQLLEAGPAELPVIRDALVGHRDALVERLWKVLGNPRQDPDRRFRAACTVAAYDADGAGAGPGRWRGASKFVAGRLLAAVQKNPSHYPALLETLRPVHGRLVGPLSGVYRDRDRPEFDRSFATTMLADYAGDQPTILADLLMDADEKQFAVIFPKLQAQGEQGRALLGAKLDQQPRPQWPEQDKEALAKQQANAAVALLRMGRPQRVWPLLKHGLDPTVRSYLIHRLGPLGAGSGAIIQRLQQEPEVSIRRALLLSLGEFGERELSPAERGTVSPRLKKLYRDDPDPGVRGAAEWLLRHWGQYAKLQEIDQEWVTDKRRREARLEQIEGELAKGKGRAQPRWYVNSQGQTMVVIPGPAKFLMGSPRTEADRAGGPEGSAERQHLKRIGHAYAIAAKEVTVAQFRRCRPDHAYNQYAPKPAYPVNSVSWYDAAEYCNWLSKKDGISPDQWCYLPNQRGKFAEGMRSKPTYLSLKGYRLPSEAEWEHACRADAVTSRYYGETAELLGRYAWYAKNSQQRELLWVGSLKPNDLGLFDMLGNAQEWCQEGARVYSPEEGGKASEDIEDTTDIRDRDIRMLRGGSFYVPAANVRSAARYSYVPTYRYIIVGFRPARTVR
ncbi:MAG TPA: SUMF1/EgtB/PvdO family nonheme iron enzyme [Gemmataceae bacterium]|nr:SUMF1/EgtB/PvdO family nonheme iron enzyme [Gemmataceae bacterium]